MIGEKGLEIEIRLTGHKVCLADALYNLHLRRKLARHERTTNSG